MTNLIDEHELQRLLDGTLPEEDRALLLQYVNDYPENWRRIALAFIEEQVLRDELKELNDLAVPCTEPATRTRHWPDRWTRVLCQAAVFCLMLGIAAWVGRSSVDQSNQRAGGNDPRVGKESVGDYTIVLAPQPLPHVGNQHVAATALHDHQDAVERMLMPLFDQQSQGVFRDHGYTVNEEPVIYVVQGQQGEQYVVPHRNVSFVAHRE